MAAPRYGWGEGFHLLWGRGKSSRLSTTRPWWGGGWGQGEGWQKRTKRRGRESTWQKWQSSIEMRTWGKWSPWVGHLESGGMRRVERSHRSWGTLEASRHSNMLITPWLSICPWPDNNKSHTYKTHKVYGFVLGGIHVILGHTRSIGYGVGMPGRCLSVVW